MHSSRLLPWPFCSQWRVERLWDTPTGVRLHSLPRAPAIELTRPIASSSRGTHASLTQPPLRPPPYVFGPVWTALYGAMGYAAHRAFTSGTRSLNPLTRDLALQGATLYTIQLGLNLIWMPLFFKYNRPIAATVDIVCLTSVVLYMTSIWSKIDPVAGYLLWPYVGWLSFATYLCVSCF